MGRECKEIPPEKRGSSQLGAGFVLSCELRAGNAKNPTNTDFTSGRYINEYSWIYLDTNTSGLWSYAYYNSCSRS